MGGDVSVQNGEIRIGRNARVGGSVSVQTGELIAEEAEIVGSVSVGSGALKLRGGRLGGDVRAHTADVELMQGVVVEGDLRLGKSSGMSGGTEVRVPGMSIAVGALGMAASRVVIRAAKRAARADSRRRSDHRHLGARDGAHRAHGRGLDQALPRRGPAER